jgi:hypothetical protein
MTNSQKSMVTILVEIVERKKRKHLKKDGSFLIPY